MVGGAEKHSKVTKYSILGAWGTLVLYNGVGLALTTGLGDFLTDGNAHLVFFSAIPMTL